jgi:hypothetical protein
MEITDMEKTKIKNRPKPNDKKASRKKAQGGEGERKKSKIFDNANPPAPSNPMHQNRRIPYTKCVSTNINQRINPPQCRVAIWTT